MKSFKGFKKWLTVGALTLAISVPAGAASAATPYAGTAFQYKVYYVQAGTNFDWNTFLQQYFQGYYPVVTKPAPVATKPAPVVKKPAPVVQKPAPKPAPAPARAETPAVSNYASQVAKMVNQERAKAGLPALSFNTKLAGVALEKAKDMKNKNYFSHTSPTYGSPFDMMKKFGISYRYAGENIAMGQRSPQEVMKDWMNSPGHKANILSKDFSQIGVAYYQGEWVQMFIG